MQLTTKGRYAVTAMLDLAFHCDSGPVPLADIAHRQCISLSYLEQLFAQLRRQQLVRSIHGPGGGYCLEKEAGEISIAAVIAAVNERVDTTCCRGDKNCQEENRCLTHDLWEDLSEEIHEFLNGINLANAMMRRGVCQVAARQHARCEQKATVAVEPSSLTVDSFGG